MANYLITGYWGEPHVTAENDRGINAAIFGAGKYVLPVGEMFKAEYIGNNTVRLYDGKLIDNGAIAGIPAGKYVDIPINEAGQGMKRKDLIIFEYSQDSSNLVESGVFKVVSGTETSGTPNDPTLIESNLLSDNAVLDQMALFRVQVSGATISAPEIVYNTRFAGERNAVAHSENGVAYTVDFPGISKLYNGLAITVIPDITSTKTDISIDLNGLGAKPVRMTLSSDSDNSAALATVNGWFSVNTPITIRYNEKMGLWKADLQRVSAKALYGSVVDQQQVTLTVAGWVNNQQVVSVAGVLANNPVFPSPDPASQKAYGESGVYCLAQAAGTLTFACEEKPTAALKVNLAIFA